MDSRSTIERSSLILSYHDLPHQIHLEPGAMAEDQNSPRVPLEEQREEVGETTDQHLSLILLSYSILFSSFPWLLLVGEGARKGEGAGEKGKMLPEGRSMNRRRESG
jgi:hypothetical protein